VIRMKTLLLENIHPGAIQAFRAAGFDVETVPHSPGKKVLAQMMGDADILGIRSKTRIGPDILARAPRLSAIGAFCSARSRSIFPRAARRGSRSSMPPTATRAASSRWLWAK